MGALKPNASMLLAIARICARLCLRGLRGSGFKSGIARKASSARWSGGLPRPRLCFLNLFSDSIWGTLDPSIAASCNAGIHRRIEDMMLGEGFNERNGHESAI